ncbi:unnamed protein product, partial [Iphiclides podalirius]
MGVLSPYESAFDNNNAAYLYIRAICGCCSEHIGVCGISSADVTNNALSSHTGGIYLTTSSAEKISKTFKSVRNTFGNLSQHFRLGGRRRHRLAEPISPCRSPSTPVTKKKGLLGRSPTKLYSPFGIETPHSRDFRMSPYMPDTPDGLSPKRRKGVAHSWHLLAKKRPRALFH